MASINFNTDIFGSVVPKTYQARYKSWTDLLVSISNTGLKTDCVVSVSTLQAFVVDGFLSARSASYFLLGKATIEQIVYFDLFSDFYHECLRTHVLKLDKIHELWQSKKSVVPENTFLFPLAELGSSEPDFSSEKVEFDLKDLQSI